MKKGDKVRILQGAYTGVIATVEEYRERESGTGIWANYNVDLILPKEHVPDGQSVPFWEHELELIS